MAAWSLDSVVCSDEAVGWGSGKVRLRLPEERSKTVPSFHAVWCSKSSAVKQRD